MEARTHIALVSIPAFSHQVSILEFAKRLVHLHQDNFQVTCIIPTLSNSPTIASKPFFNALPTSIHCIFLPSVNSNGGNNDVLEIQLQIAVSGAMPLVREALRSLASSSKVVALVVDAFAIEAMEFGKELNMLSYIYFPCSIMMLSLGLHSSKLHETVSCEYRDHPQPIEIPGCISVHGKDLPNSTQNRSSPSYKFFLRRCQQLHIADGILVNSFTEMEPEAMKAISQKGNGPPQVHPIGPITQTWSNNNKNGSECLLWLAHQPPRSVLYVSFGSGGTLSQDQINELALGLELSRKKFLWVNVRAPNDSATASYLSDDNEFVDPLQFLPSGFLERTKGQGFVMSGWAPQSEILSHISIGAFLTHCGWNSILESVVHGVPMIAWPLFAEQRLNAALITDGLKIALRVKIGGNGVVVKEEIVGLVKGVMEGLEGGEIRRRVKELQGFAACAMMEDGSSTKMLSMLAIKWKSLGTITED